MKQGLTKREREAQGAVTFDTGGRIAKGQSKGNEGLVT